MAEATVATLSGDPGPYRAPRDDLHYELQLQLEKLMHVHQKHLWNGGSRERVEFQTPFVSERWIDAVTGDLMIRHVPE
jgi:hypothetical protein